jgi:uncharacterized protein DUF6325
MVDEKGYPQERNMNQANDDLTLGPVDIAVIGYPPDAPRTGEAIPIFVGLARQGTIRVLDVKGIRKEADGSFSGFDVTDAEQGGAPDLVAFEGAQTGLIGDDDLRVAVEAMEPEAVAIMIVFENRWAAPFVAAVQRNGGKLLAYERVSAEDLIDAVEALDAETG